MLFPTIYPPIRKTGTSRRQKGKKERKNIDVPDIISTYNHKMGGGGGGGCRSC